jgi:hypothetical protein
MTEEQFAEFVNKMTCVNRDIDKRNKASIKIKEKWKDPIYLEKMKNRKTVSSEDKSIKMKEKWADPIWKANMLEKRRNKNNETN